jgi:hypothetical protein
MQLFLKKVLAHLTEVIGQEFIIGYAVIEVNAFSETVQIRRSLLR